MRLQRESSEITATPRAFATSLPPQVLDRAADGLCWISLIGAVSSVILVLMNQWLQPEYATAWGHPVLRLSTLAIFFLSVGFILLLRAGRLTKQRLLDLGMVFQVVIAFLCGLTESAVYNDPHRVVIGHSGIALWMMICGRLVHNAPLKSAIAGGLCVLMWPLAYWTDLQIFGYQPMPISRILVWILPLIVVAVWMHALNKRFIALYVQQQRAEDIGSYQLLERINEGGMGEVWRARHKTLARDAAIKLIRPAMLNGSSGRQEQSLKRRFEREAQVTASLRSPHTVALYDFGRSTDGAFYYVMELIDGVDLETLVERFGPLEPARVVNILHQVAHSLEEAHRAGLVHRDIKPRNILLGRLGLEFDFAKVLDFGLVKTRDKADGVLTTLDGITTGTPAYVAPEVALGRAIDGRADLYSLGCTAYYLLTGKMVFDAATPTAYAIAHVQQTPRPLSERSELPIPPALESIVMRLLAKQPEDRIQTAHDLGRRLRALPEFDRWTPERAERWWETNLPNLTVIPEAAPDAQEEPVHA